MDKHPARIGARVQIPNPALKPFEVLIGTWKTVGSHGLFPDKILQGKTSFEWIEDGAFLLMRSEIEDERFPNGLAIIGSDDVQKKFCMLYFDERGVSRIQNVRMESNVLTWWRDQPDFSQRYTMTISSDGKTIVGKGELSKDGATWEKDLDLTYTKSS